MDLFTEAKPIIRHRKPTSCSGSVVYRLGSRVPRGVADIGVVGEKGPSPVGPKPGLTSGLKGDALDPFLRSTKGCTRTLWTSPPKQRGTRTNKSTASLVHISNKIIIIIIIIIIIVII